MLITLVIIGVVAALTIPNLMQKYREQTTVKKMQKFYSTLSNAYSLAIKEYGNVEEWKLQNTDKENAEKVYELLFKPYFKIAKNCGTTNTGNCIANTDYRFLNNERYANFGHRNSTTYYKILLDDGAAILWRVHPASSSMGEYLTVFYDVNGPKGPNQSAVDFFNFMVFKDKVYPSGTPGFFGTKNFETYCKRTNTGAHCPAWVIFKGNMDYLHCDDLSWTGKDKCK